MKYYEFKDHLVNDLIPFWDKLRDDSFGGFYGSADHLAIPDKESDKGCILNSRILWFYSNAYLTLKDRSLLDNARHAFNFLKHHCYDPVNGGVYWSVSFKGEPADDTKHTYNQAFAIYALSSYFRASGDRSALELAYSLYQTIETKCSDCGGYLEAFSKTFEPVSNEKLSENGVMAERTMNTLLHVLEAYTELYIADGSAEVSEKISAILKRFKEKMFDPEREILEVFFDHEYNTLIDLESYGHDIEASWLINRACDALGDSDLNKAMLPVIKGLAKSAYNNGIDQRVNAMCNESENGIRDEKKVWWVQAESVVGLYNAYRLDLNENKYLKMSEDIWDYIKNNVIDKNSGEWIENIPSTGEPDPKQRLVHQWKCPYHNGRMCMEMMQRLPE